MGVLDKATELTAVEQNICHTFRITPEEFLAQKNNPSMPRSLNSEPSSMHSMDRVAAADFSRIVPSTSDADMGGYFGRRNDPWQRSPVPVQREVRIPRMLEPVASVQVAVPIVKRASEPGSRRLGFKGSKE